MIERQSKNDVVMSEIADEMYGHYIDTQHMHKVGRISIFDFSECLIMPHLQPQPVTIIVGYTA